MSSTYASASELTARQRSVYTDILSQAITGELVGMANYAAMVRLYSDEESQRDTLIRATSELNHSERFRRVARDLGMTPIVNLEAPYWNRIRSVFLEYADAKDLVACLLIQEVMLESFAYSMYHAVADVACERLSTIFRAIGNEEDGHVDHAVKYLNAALTADREEFENKAERVHDAVMTTLAEMLGENDSAGHCGLCSGSCVKGALDQVGLDRATLRGLALNRYLSTLDRLGVRGERSLAWVARLPM